VPKPFPKEFRRDVIAVARQGDQSIASVARARNPASHTLGRLTPVEFEILASAAHAA